MTDVKLEIIGDIQRLVLGPNDKVVVTIKDFDRLDADDALSISKTVARSLGIDEHRILVCGDEITLSVIEG